MFSQPVSVTSGGFLARRHSAGDALRSNSNPHLSTYCPPPLPDHDCQEFETPEGHYKLLHQVSFRSLQPTFSIGTTASLVSIKYKETVHPPHRYESHPDAQSLHRAASTEESEDISSLSSTSSSHNSPFTPDSNTGTTNTIASPPTVITTTTAAAAAAATTTTSTITSTTSKNAIPRLGSSLEGPSFLSNANIHPVASTAHTSLPSSPNGSSNTFSFLSRSVNDGRRKPLTDIAKSSSSFVSRIVTSNQLANILVSRTSDDTNLFYNCGYNFIWVDACGRPKEPLSRVVFGKACPTSHDVNMLTRGSDHLDVIIGFSSGDIIWFDPLTNKYGRINKGGVMSSVAVTMIRWMPGSESLFMASFADGVIIIFDKDRDDEPFHPENRMMTGFSGNIPPGVPAATHQRRKHFISKTVDDKNQYIHSNLSNITLEEQKFTFRISKPSPKISGRKTNPVSHWKLSNKSITAFAFSPDCQHVAVVGLDGLLRIINFVRETLIDIYQAYYGGFTCVSWSPDGQYILTGGEDDLVTMWAFHEQRIVARCQGHKSFVTDVAFDPWRCDENVYRFASVGEDAKLILWDFSVNALHRPKTRTTGRVRGSSVSSQHQAPTSAYKSREDNQPTLHPIQSKNHVAFLQPTVVKAIHADPCVGIYFREDVIVTTDRRGRVSVWQRPPKTTSSPKASNQRYV